MKAGGIRFGKGFSWNMGCNLIEGGVWLLLGRWKYCEICVIVGQPSGWLN